MGCSESKIDNKQTLKQCKERKAFIKQSVSAHTTLADAHIAYASALKNIGAALSDYAHVTGNSTRTPENEVWDFFLSLMEDVPGPISAEDVYKGVMFKKPTIRGNVVEESEKESLQLNMKKSMSNVKILKVFKEVDDCFIKASASACEVYKILEANKLHYHSNFAKGHIDHSTRVMRVITFNKPVKGAQVANYVKNDFVPKEETLAAILDKMQEWEKKLHNQVKAGEEMKYAHQKKVASINKLKKMGASNDLLERTQATVSRLHTRYIVDMQCIDSTISEINCLRDERLYPKLVQLVQEMGIMWENMRKQHEKQLKIMLALKTLESSQSLNETSNQNLICTKQLHHHVTIWCSEIIKVIKHQKDYIKSLSNWLKLNVMITKNNNLKPQKPKIESLLHTWLDELEKLQVEDTETTMDTFAEVLRTIFEYQSNEMKMKEKCEETRRELTKRSRKFDEWCDKQISKNAQSDVMDIDVIDDMEVIAEQEMVVEALKRRLVAEEEAYQKLCVEVNEKMVVNLKIRLLEVLTSVSEFARACSLMYKKLKSELN